MLDLARPSADDTKGIAEKGKPRDRLSGKGLEMAGAKSMLMGPSRFPSEFEALVYQPMLRTG